ncbi:sterol carrier family protein [Frondihabitans peucedani]|uniref:Sterol carrier family protein n=1 Tax=Frondihabitans peucedani TaxID=598626 RepID=A0ABP8E4U0_9MICO
MAKVRIDPAAGTSAVAEALAEGDDAPRPVKATAVRYLLQLLGDREPGATVEVRVPPFGAVQFMEGLSHTRGTPPNVVETDAATFIALADGRLAWSDALDGALVSASGSRADLSRHLPIAWR